MHCCYLTLCEKMQNQRQTLLYQPPPPPIYSFIQKNIYGASIFQLLYLALEPYSARAEFCAFRCWEGSMHICQTHGPHYQQCSTFVEETMVSKLFFSHINFLSWSCSVGMLGWGIMFPILKEKWCQRWIFVSIFWTCGNVKVNFFLG